VSALRVTSRTSVERFRDTRLPMKDIAKQLGVTKILEGGVQRAGERVRINVQLIDAATDAHLWAETYDRDLTAANIFMIQSEVAAAIAAALNTTLTPAEMGRVGSIPTQSLEAWEAYQLGKQRMAKRTSATLAEAEASFRKAIALDGKFASAYAGLADATWLKSDYSGQPVGPAVAQAEELLAQALRLDPNLSEALTTQAKFAQDRRDFERAEAGYLRAIQLNPSYATAYQWYAQLLSLQGREAEALQSLQKAVELDPLSPTLQISLGWSLSDRGRFDRALRRFEKARDIDPSSPLPYAAIGANHAYAFGRLDDAIPYLEKAIELDVGGYRNAVQLARIYLDLGDDAQAEHWLDRAMQDGTANTVRAYQHLYRGQHAQAITFSRRSLEIDPRDKEAMAVLRDADFRKDEINTTRARYAAAFPELLAQPSPEIDFSNWNAAIDLAMVLQRTGEHERAAQLLDRAAAYTRSTTRMGPWGYGIADVRILALHDQEAAALVALRQAVTAGWRGPYWRYYRDFDPNLDSIRNESDFKAVFADIERDMARQRAELAARPRDEPHRLAPTR
jgi:tetratricopeptide (TPR) repeat protein